MGARDAVAERQKLLGHRMTTYEEIVRSFDAEDDQPASFVEVSDIARERGVGRWLY